MGTFAQNIEDRTFIRYADRLTWKARERLDDILNYDLSLSDIDVDSLCEIVGWVLNNKQLNLFKLYYIEGLRPSHIAKIINITPQNVSTTIKQVKRKLTGLDFSLATVRNVKQLKELSPRALMLNDDWYKQGCELFPGVTTIDKLIDYVKETDYLNHFDDEHYYPAFLNHSETKRVGVLKRLGQLIHIGDLHINDGRLLGMWPWNLMCAVFGVKDLWETMDSSVVFNTPQPVFSKLHKGPLRGITKEIAKDIEEETLNTLTVREKDIICYRFKEHMTLEEVSEVYDVIRERVRQIEAKALRKLRNLSRVKLIKSAIRKHVYIYPISFIDAMDIVPKYKDRKMMLRTTNYVLSRLKSEGLGCLTDEKIKCLTSINGVENSSFWKDTRDSTISLVKEAIMETPHMKEILEYGVEGYIDHLICEYDTLKKSIIVVKKDGESENRSDISIEDMDFSVRTFNCLKRAGCSTLGDIMNQSYENLMNIRNLGKRSFNELIEKLREYGHEIEPTPEE